MPSREKAVEEIAIRCHHSKHSGLEKGVISRTETLVDRFAGVLDLRVDRFKLCDKLLPVVGILRRFQQFIRAVQAIVGSSARFEKEVECRPVESIALVRADVEYKLIAVYEGERKRT
jgi:hypothetical protein